MKVEIYTRNDFQRQRVQRALGKAKGLKRMLRMSRVEMEFTCGIEKSGRHRDIKISFTPGPRETPRNLRTIGNAIARTLNVAKSQIVY